MTYNILSNWIKHLEMQMDNKVKQKHNKKRILRLWQVNNFSYPFSIRETPPKEVGPWSTNSIFDCIRYYSSNKNRK